MGRHADTQGRGLSRLMVVLGVLTVAGVMAIVVVTGGWLDPDAQQVPEPEVTPLDLPAAPSTAWPIWGFTHTERSADDPVASAGGKTREALASQPVIQNQHIMGFGALNPSPRPGVYDFTSLDERVKLMAETKSMPVITLCCAPDWMKGGKPGKTNWSALERAPRPEHYDDFARLAAAVAKRYPNVRHFLVWNELKGFWDATRNKWNAEGYTELYNKVYKALKAVNPDIKVGGPYTDVASFSGETEFGSMLKGPWGIADGRVLDVIDYWLENNEGADFIVVDGGTASTGGPIPDEFRAAEKLADVTGWIKERTSLPIWWAEVYGDAPDEENPDRQVAVQAAAMIALAESGARTALYWNEIPKGDKPCSRCLWSPTGGQGTTMLDLIQGFAEWFPEGTKPVKVDVSTPKVLALANEENLVAVNTTGDEVTATVDGKSLTLKPYEVHPTARPRRS